MKIIDLSHPIREGMTIYPGDPFPKQVPFLEHEKDYCHVCELTMGSHTGTHADAPYHFLKDGKTIEEMPLSRFFGKGVILDLRKASECEVISQKALIPYEKKLTKGIFVLLWTGWDRYWDSSNYLRHPFLSAEAARFLVQKKVSLVGIDALSIDSSTKEVFLAHEILLGAEITIVENLCNLEEAFLEKKMEDGFFSFLPLPLFGSDGSPVRAVCLIP